MLLKNDMKSLFARRPFRRPSGAKMTPKVPAPKMSLFPKMALITLDLMMTLAALLSALMLILTAAGQVPFDFKVDGVAASPLLARGLGTVFFVLPTLFFWAAHLLLQGTWKGQPFIKRNVILLYAMAGILLAGALGNGLTWSYTITEPIKEATINNSAQPQHNAPTSQIENFKVGYGDRYKDPLDYIHNSGILYSLILFSFGAIFQRGVELQEEEKRLREEQEYTI